jgi:hypothetical protein
LIRFLDKLNALASMISWHAVAVLGECVSMRRFLIDRK